MADPENIPFFFFFFEGGWKVGVEIICDQRQHLLLKLWGVCCIYRKFGRGGGALGTPHRSTTVQVKIETLSYRVVPQW